MKIFPYERFTIKTELSMPMLQKILSAYIYPGVQWDESKMGRKEFSGYLDEKGFDIQPPPIGQGLGVLMEGDFIEQEEGISIEVTARMYGQGLIVIMVFAALGPIFLILGLLAGDLFNALWGAMAVILVIALQALWWSQEKKYKDILCKRIGNGAYIVQG